MLQIDLWKRIVIVLTCLAGLWLALPNAFYAPVEKHNDAVAAIEVQGSTPELEAQRALWPEWMPSGLVNLGLDLRGGAHLLAEVQLADVYASRMEAQWPEVRDALRSLTPVRREEAPAGELRVRLNDPSKMAEALQITRDLARPVTTVTGAGGSDINVSGANGTITITLSDAEKQATDERTMQQSLEIVRRRIDEVGTREPTIQRQGADRILIQVPGIGSAAELKAIIGTTAQLTFNPVVNRGSNEADNPGIGNAILPAADEEGVFYTIETAPVVTGEQLVDAQPSFDQNGAPAVSFRFDTSGARKFGDYTAENIGSPFAIVLDNEVISAPTIQSHIPGGSGIITGRFSVEESTNLAVLLRAGALPAGLSFVEERTIGPELGQDSIDAGKIATMVAFTAVLFFMWASYGLFGFFANIALIINVGLIFGLLSLMAVDANVLIFERIREEQRNAKGAARAISLGYERALSAILDANITTFIVAVILFALGSGPVRGFAVTLGLGIVTSVFTAYFVTRLLVVIWFERRRPKTIEV